MLSTIYFRSRFPILILQLMLVLFFTRLPAQYVGGQGDSYGQETLLEPIISPTPQDSCCIEDPGVVEVTTMADYGPTQCPRPGSCQSYEHTITYLSSPANFNPAGNNDTISLELAPAAWITNVAYSENLPLGIFGTIYFLSVELPIDAQLNCSDFPGQPCTQTLSAGEPIRLFWVGWHNIFTPLTSGTYNVFVDVCLDPAMPESFGVTERFSTRVVDFSLFLPFPTFCFQQEINTIAPSNCGFLALAPPQPVPPSGIVEIQTTHLNDIAACLGPDSFLVSIVNSSPDTLTDLVLNPGMPAGMNYIPNSADNASDLNLVPANQPQLQLNATTLFPGDSVVVTFAANPGCEAIDFLNTAGNITQNIAELTYTCLCEGSGGAFPGITDIESPGDSYNILYPDLVITNVTPQSFFGNLNDNICVREITIANAGNGAVDTIWFQDVHDSEITTLEFSMEGRQMTPSTSTSTEQFWILDTLLMPNQSLTVTQKIRIDSCESADSKYTVSWGCAGDTCDSYVDYANVLINIGQPRMTINRYGYTGANYCGRDGTVIFEYINNGKEAEPNAGIATDITLSFGYTQNVVALDSFMISADSNGLYTPMNSASIPGLVDNGGSGGVWTFDLTNLTADPDGLGDGLEDINNDQIWGDLAVDDTFYVKFKAHVDCDLPKFDNQCPLTYSHTYADPTITYSDQCFELEDAVGANPLAAFTGSCQTYEEGAADLFLGDTATYNFCLQGVMGGDLVCPNDSFRILLDIPEGISPVLGSQSFTGAGDPVTLLSSVPSSIYPGGTLLTLQGGGLSGCYNLDFVLDCIGVTQAEERKRILYEIQYQCDPENNCACIQRLGCDSLVIYAHYNAPCFVCRDRGSMETTRFEVTRTTVNTLTDPNPRTDAAYSCDTICWVAEGNVRLGNSNNAFLDITYTLPGNVNFLSLADFEVSRIKCITGAVISTCSGNIPPPTITSSGVGPMTFTLTFDLGNMAGGNCFSGTNFNRNRCMRVSGCMVVEDDPSLPPLLTYEIPDFRGTFYSQGNGNQFRSCGGLGFRFDLLKPLNYFQTLPLVTTCPIAPLELRWGYTNCEIDDFPNEIRQLGRIVDTIFVQLPPWYQFVPGSAAYTTLSGGAVPAGSETILSGTVETGLRLGFSEPFGGWPIQDKSANGVLQSFRMEVEPNCLSSDLDTVTFFYHVRDRDYASDPNCKVDIFASTDQIITNRKPDLGIEPLLETVAVICDTVEFEVKVQNRTFGADASNTWLALNDTTENLHFFEAFDISTGTAVPVTSLSNYVNSTASHVWIKAGTIPQVDCKIFRFRATFDTCLFTPIQLLSSWDCHLYPQDPENQTIACDLDSAEMFMDPKSGNLQISLIEAPQQIAFCDTTDSSFFCVEISNSDAGCIDSIFVTLDLPPGVAHVSGSSLLFYSSAFGGIPVSIPDPVAGSEGLKWDLSALSPQFSANGLVGAIGFPNNKLKVCFKLSAECGVDLENPANNAFDVRVDAIDNCQNKMSRTLRSAGIGTVVAPTYSYIHQLKVDSIIPCRDTSSLEVLLINQGSNNVNGNDDTLCITLPSGVNYSYDFNPIKNAPGAFDFMISGNQICWPIPGGLVPGDTVNFSFGIIANSDLPCGSIPFSLQTYRKDSAYCDLQDSTCFVGTTLEGIVVSGTVTKPGLVLSNLSFLNPLLCGTAQDSVEVDVMNLGEAVLPGGTTQIDFYCDNDDNGVYSTGDVHLGQSSTTVGIGNGQTVTISASIAGNCSRNRALIAVINADSNCVCISSQAALPGLEAGFTVPDACLGDTILMVNTTQNLIPTIWEWDFGDSTALVIPNNNDFEPSVVYPNPGTYTITLITKDSCGKDTAVQLITILPDPVANAGLDTTICALGAVQLGGSPTASGGGNIFTYDWSPAGNLDSSVLANPVASPTLPTEYQVVVSNESGCSDKDRVLVTVLPVSIADAGNDSIIGSCSDSLVIGPAIPNPALIYNWSPLTGLSNPNLPNPSASPANTTEYILTVTDTNGCMAMDTVLISVLDTLFTGRDTLVFCGDTIQIGPDFPISNLLYSWNPPAFLSDPGIHNPYAYPPDTTVFVLTATDSSNCLLTDTFVVNVLPRIRVSKTVIPDKAYPAQTLTYSIEVCNDGNTDANGLVLNDFWPNSIPISGCDSALTILTPLPITVNVPAMSCTTLTAIAQVCSSESIRGMQLTNVVEVFDPACNGVVQDSASTVILIACPFAFTADTASCDSTFGICLRSLTNEFAQSTTGKLVKRMRFCLNYPDSLLEPMPPVPPGSLSFMSTIPVPSVNSIGVMPSASFTLDNRNELILDFTSGNFDLPADCVVVCLDFKLVCGAVAGFYENILIECGNVLIEYDDGSTTTSFIDNGSLTVDQGCPAAPDAGFTCVDSLCLHPDSNVVSIPMYADELTGTHEWSVGNVVVSSFQQNQPVFTFGLPPGATELRHVHKTLCGNDTLIKTVNVHAAPSVVINPQPGDTICSGQCVSLITNLANCSGCTYQWSTGATSPTINVCSGGGFQVDVTASNGCMGSDSAVIFASAQSTPVANAGPDHTITCLDSAQLGFPSTGGPSVNYSWSPMADLTNPILANPIAYPLATTSYELTCQNKWGCKDKDTVTVNIEPFDIFCRNVPAVPSGDTLQWCLSEGCVKIGCIGLMVLNPACGRPDIVWTANPGGPMATTDPFICVSPTVTTTYTQMVTCENGCLQSSSIIVAPPGSLSIDSCEAFFFQASQLSSLELNARIDLNGSFVGPFVYHWSDNLGNIITETGTTVEPSVCLNVESVLGAGYMASVYIEDLGTGCRTDTCSTGFVTFPIALDSFPCPNSGNKSSSLADLMNQFGQLQLPEGELEVTVHPNPFSQSISIALDLPSSMETRILITDMHGRTVRNLGQESLSAGNHTVVWDGENQAGQKASSGIYFARIVAGTQIKVARLILIRK